MYFNCTDVDASTPLIAGNYVVLLGALCGERRNERSRMWICTCMHAGTVLPNIHTKHTGLSQQKQQRRRCCTVKLQRVGDETEALATL